MSRQDSIARLRHFREDRKNARNTGDGRFRQDRDRGRDRNRNGSDPASQDAGSQDSSNYAQDAAPPQSPLDPAALLQQGLQLLQGGGPGAMGGQGGGFAAYQDANPDEVRSQLRQRWLQ